MGVKVATCLHWSQQPSLPNWSPFSYALASGISSPSSKRIGTRGHYHRGGATVAALVCQYVHRHSVRLSRSWSFDHPLQKKRTPSIRRVCNANLESFSDDEFSKIHELALRFQASDATSMQDESNLGSESANEDARVDIDDVTNFVEDVTKTPPFQIDPADHPWMVIEQEPHGWPGRDEISSAIVEKKANSVDLPLSLRIIKKKLHWKEGFREAGESTCCSVKKAFSSLVFIIREIHSFTMQMREVLFYKDLQGILSRVLEEVHASFVWLFQRVFSCTPTLMVHVMILLANFTFYSMGHNTAIAAATVPPYAFCTSTIEATTVVDFQAKKHQKFDSSAIKALSVLPWSGKTVSVGGNSGDGGKVRPVATGTDGNDGKFDQSSLYGAVLPDGASQLSSMRTTREAESLSLQEPGEEELMQNAGGGETTDHETETTVSSKFGTSDRGDSFNTNLLYQTNLSQDPHNPLLLANYAQFLYVVAQDYDRAEEYFKRAIGVEPPDAEAYSKYATFLWKVKNDLWAAEETYLEAISAEPTDAYHAANYAHFLWNTGGKDTCFPLDNSPDNSQEV